MNVDLLRLLMAAAVTFAANYPLGWARGGVRPRLKENLTFSKGWWRALGMTLLYLGLSLPTVWLVQRKTRLDPWYAWEPALLLVALVAQAVGERIRYRRNPPPPSYLQKRKL